MLDEETPVRLFVTGVSEREGIAVMTESARVAVCTSALQEVLAHSGLLNGLFPRRLADTAAIEAIAILDRRYRSRLELVVAVDEVADVVEVVVVAGDTIVLVIRQLGCARDCATELLTVSAAAKLLTVSAAELLTVYAIELLAVSAEGLGAVRARAAVRADVHVVP